MEIIQASYLNSERGKNEIKKERKCEDQVTAPLEAEVVGEWINPSSL
jgi:hypothetical protein